MPYADPKKQRAAELKAQRLKRARLRALTAAGVAAAEIVPLRTRADVLAVLERALAPVLVPALQQADPLGCARAVVAIAAAANDTLRDSELDELRQLVQQLQERLAA